MRPVPLVPTVQATMTLLLIARTARRLARPTLVVSSNVMIRSPIVLILMRMIVLVDSDKQWMHIFLLVQLEVMVRLQTGTLLW